ncbi:MAG TPA: rod shape-determining protein MreC [Candidatus Flavonifractor merdipullorum]|uniref:Cell shape-determining protein MreC n=1 Tax=Candidatus Flavonifractor merdipullorum TaxID=2838590 RepID=A0A9D1RTB4_9FIRM|nr:rod shape-determining protein MreC [Candidatus Flavonifractor merdipullorum]
MKDFMRNNGILILIIAVLLALIITVLSVIMTGFADPLTNLVGIVSTPFRNGINAVVNWTEEVYSDAFQQDALKADYEQLKKDYAKLQEELREAQQAKDENERLRNLLGLKERRRELNFEAATVTAYGADNWDSAITISKGTDAGVTAGNCVVDEYGNLVGVVETVGTNWSTVMTIVDSDMEMGGLIARTNDAAILEGDFDLMGQGKLKLSYLPETSELMAGDQVLTSGLSGMYPSGLVVGSIEEVRTDASGMNRYAVIVPETELNNLEQVFVVTSFDVVE